MNELDQSLYQHALEVLISARDEKSKYPGETFLSPYQIAVELTRGPHRLHYRVEDVGGKGHGQYTSLAKEIAHTLSSAFERNRKNGTRQEIQRGFFSNQHLTELRFDGDVVSSKTGSGDPLSIFRAV